MSTPPRWDLTNVYPSRVSPGSTTRLHLVGLDACLMSQVEVLSAMAPHARYFTSSEETEPALGWAYTGFLSALTKNPGMSTVDLVKQIRAHRICERDMCN